MTNLSRHCTLNGTDLTDYIVFDDPPSPIQPKRLIKNKPIIGSRRNVLWSEGLDNFGYNVNLQFDPSQWADYDTVTALFQNLTDGDLFYPRSDRFMVCKYGSCVPVQSKSSGPGQSLRLKGTLYSESAEMYGDIAGSWLELETESGIDIFTETNSQILFETQDIYNIGTISAPIYSATITGGSTIIMTIGTDNITLTPALLSDETMILDRFGQISQTYIEAFGDGGTKFAADKYASSSAAVSGGSLVISTSGYAVYYLAGSWPIKAGGLLVTFTATSTGSGTVSFQWSSDGTNWNDIQTSNDSEWADSTEMEIYVPQAEGYNTGYIRWVCDASITSVAIDNLTISQSRYVPESEVPTAPISTTLTSFSLTGATTYSKVWRNRYVP